MSTHHVVVGYDGGAGGQDALAFAVRWCRASGDRLLVASIHPTPPAAGISRVDAEWAAYQRERDAGLLDEARRFVPDDVAADFERLDSASAAHALSDLGEEGDVLLVLGGRHSPHRRRTNPGSTASRLLQGAASPVVLVPTAYAEQGLDPLTRVSVAYIDTPEARVALEHAGRMAVHLGASLDVVTAVPETRVSPATGEPARFAHAQEDEFAADLADAVIPEGVEVTRTLLDGPVVDALTDLLPADTDLLVCGSRGYGPVRRVLLGGVTHHVVRHSRVPVAVVPRSG